MDSNRIDISQLRQYLNGELDAKAMHELEKRAQQDPFLMDALEGYEAVKPKEMDTVMAGLQWRLQQRTGPKERKLMPWQRLAAAVAMFIVCGVGLWWYLAHQTPQQMQVVQTLRQPELPPAPTQKAVPLADSAAVQLPVKTQSIAAEVKRKPQPVTVKQSEAVQQYTTAEDVQKNVPELAAAPQQDTAIKNNSQQGYTARRKMVILGAGRKIPTIKPDSQQLISQQLTGKADQADVELAPGQHLVTGKLLDGADRQPLIGALIRVKDMPTGAVTDRDGNFRVAARSKDMLVISSTGYESREVSAGHTDSAAISLQPQKSSLSEVIVMNYGMRSKPVTRAEPLMGWKAYQSYLDHAKSPDRQTGHVRLEFTVNPNGGLDDFTVTGSLSEAADQAAVNLIKKGPGWRGSPDGKAEKVKVKVSFE